MPRWNNELGTNDEVQRLKRQAVLQEAGRAFSKRGFHNTSLDDVAKALQVSKGTLYNYVKDKQEILWEFHLMAYEIGKSAIEEAKAVADATGAAALHRTLRLYILRMTQELGACGALAEVDGLRPEDRLKAVKHRDSFEKEFVALVERGVRDGSMRKVDPKVAVFTFMGAINWLPRWYSPEGRLSPEQIAISMTDILLAGLVTQPEAIESAAVPQEPDRPRAARAATKKRATPARARPKG
ncbi:TetR/AcrR family transcriptional regulator [Pseudorhodoferax sp.]|uniref:TetR/AcrR family transcriptional regulator n=1 Tax=Pseudorhodoferax sp. TaxID=1993553 RepID=UPI002DD647FF|nr:TetR/AcrR family transcriptional regulator [Pseudorhodoferax sp.]